MLPSLLLPLLLPAPSHGWTYHQLACPSSSLALEGEGQQDSSSTDWASCATLCQGRAACRGWTWAAGSCSTFSAISSSQAASSSTKSGERSCDSKYSGCSCL